jgi:hypothetical protein
MSNLQQIDVVRRSNNGVIVEATVMRDWFIYSFNVASIAAVANAVSTINIQADANFIAEKCTCFADVAGGAQTVDTQVVPLVNVMLTDSGSGRSLFNTALPVASICGPNLAGAFLPFGRCFTANSNIVATFNNYSAATTYENLFLSLHGYKEWTLNERPIGRG